MYGASVVSGHFGDVVLWELSPPAAGEVLIRSEPELPGRPSAAVVRELGSPIGHCGLRRQYQLYQLYQLLVQLVRFWYDFGKLGDGGGYISFSHN